MTDCRRRCWIKLLLERKYNINHQKQLLVSILNNLEYILRSITSQIDYIN